MRKVDVTVSLPSGEKIAEWTTDEDGTHTPAVSDDLPPLPDIAEYIAEDRALFSAEQMQTYARAAVEDLEHDNAELRGVIQRQDAVLQAKAEPVAFLGSGGSIVQTSVNPSDQCPHNWTPLYAHPPATQPQSEPLGWIENGEFKQNAAYRLKGPTTLAWKIPVYTHPPATQPQDIQALQTRITELEVALDMATQGKYSELMLRRADEVGTARHAKLKIDQDIQAFVDALEGPPIPEPYDHDTMEPRKPKPLFSVFQMEEYADAFAVQAIKQWEGR